MPADPILAAAAGNLAPAAPGLSGAVAAGDLGPAAPGMETPVFSVPGGEAVAQVVSITSVGDVTDNGSMRVVYDFVLAAGEKLVAVVAGDVPAVWAAKVKVAMEADAAFSSRFIIVQDGATLHLTLLEAGEELAVSLSYASNLTGISSSVGSVTTEAQEGGVGITAPALITPASPLPTTPAQVPGAIIADQAPAAPELLSSAAAGNLSPAAPGGITP